MKNLTAHIRHNLVIGIKTKGIKILLLIFAINVFPAKLPAQNYQTQQNQVLAYNVLFNGLMGGVGGVIHKSPGEKTWKVFLKNFGKGSLGGLVCYSAKYQTWYLHDPDNTFLAPVNRLYYFLGHSMVMNASMNKKLLSVYHFNMYGLDMTMNFEQKENKFFKARLSLASVGGFSYFLLVGHTLNFYKSLEYGVYYFDMNPAVKNFGGFATFNSIVIGKNPLGRIYYSVIPHEFVHTYQFYDFHPISNFYTHAMKPTYEKIGLYRTFVKYVKLDYEVAFQGALYFMQPKPRYYKNFFEFEAEHFAERVYIQR